MYGKSASGSSLDAETNLNQNYFRDYDPTTGRYNESDPLGFGGGQLSTFAYVGANPLAWTDSQGLANSGLMIDVPGTNYIVRIDPPHVPGQQRHAHIYDDNKNLITAISEDGTGSHGQCPKKLPKNKKLLKYLLGKGIAISFAGDLLFLYDLVTDVGRSVDPYNPYYYSDPNDVPTPDYVPL
ncbi:RHS repeat-associated core domain-containing protein [Solimicrobium silvestre]|uniref:RHS repeat-associated core domain n=1 Tax=Solimicrobium silvestre TaxID=2099400 RepID=A0A2S9GXD7_9BURK|nr:RHS repeat-associated core domain-containing protein [Solimicrobium silvestre]PRC92384.1 RHS repeat-associated core domain [Solimicrobium silvestre]